MKFRFQQLYIIKIICYNKTLWTHSWHSSAAEFVTHCPKISDARSNTSPGERLVRNPATLFASASNQCYSSPVISLGPSFESVCQLDFFRLALVLAVTWLEFIPCRLSSGLYLWNERQNHFNTASIRIVAGSFSPFTIDRNVGS